MTDQLMLGAFCQKTIPVSEATKDLRPYNRVILNWEVDYRGFSSKEPDEPQGYLDFHIYVSIKESLIRIRDQKTGKKVERPGYKLTVAQDMAFEGQKWESYLVHEESFKQTEIRKAFDAFQRELLNIQGWIDIAESRAKFIPSGKDAFECPFCGWVTDELEDDITCYGCGKRFWSESLLKRQARSVSG